MFDREMVEQVAGADVGGRLGDQLSTLHGLTVPVGGAIDAHFNSTKLGSSGRVLVVSIYIEVAGSRLAAVNVLSNS